MAVSFIAGSVLGGLITAIATNLYLKGKYETKIAESYNKGYQKGREVEQRAIFDYIDTLKVDGNACIYETEILKR